MIESETLNRSFTIILAVQQPYSIMLHVTYMYTQCKLTCKPLKGLGVSVPYIYRESSLGIYRWFEMHGRLQRLSEKDLAQMQYRQKRLVMDFYFQFKS